jgi:hypothetical protein
MLYIEKTQKLLDLIKSLDYILLNEKKEYCLSFNKSTIYEISREVYFLSSHRYIDNKDYLFNLENKFSHYIQLLIIKPNLQLVLYEKTSLNLDKIKKIKNNISIVNNSLYPKLYKYFLILINIICL